MSRKLGYIRCTACCPSDDTSLVTEIDTPRCSKGALVQRYRRSWAVWRKDLPSTTLPFLSATWHIPVDTSGALLSTPPGTVLMAISTWTHGPSSLAEACQNTSMGPAALYQTRVSTRSPMEVRLASSFMGALGGKWIWVAHPRFGSSAAICQWIWISLDAMDRCPRHARV